MKQCRLGYYFARIKDTSTITTVACWGDRIEKDTDREVEIIERVPQKVVEHCRNGVKILNLKKTIGRKDGQNTRT